MNEDLPLMCDWKWNDAKALKAKWKTMTMRTFLLSTTDAPAADNFELDLILIVAIIILFQVKFLSKIIKKNQF